MPPGSRAGRRLYGSAASWPRPGPEPENANRTREGVMTQLDHRVAIVTGASTGIGLAIAKAFAAEGAKVVLAARSREKLEAGAAAIRAAGGEALAVVTDVTKENQGGILF